MRWISRLLAVLALAIVAGGVVLVVGSLLSLDWDRSHTARSEALPAATPNSGDGLVQIAIGSSHYRARVAGLGNDGPGLVLLHGFPETSIMWAPLIEAAAARGLRVVAFDQRGYSPGARPEAVADYRVPALVDDVLAVADALDLGRFHLVGHDWGCVVGWAVVAGHPERIRSFSALSIPHPAALAEGVRDDPPAYIRFFRLPWLPELLFTWNRLALLRAALYDPMPEEVRDEYLAVFSEPGALTGALAWYRAIAASLEAPAGSLEIDRPVLFVWGSGEMWVTEERRRRQRELLHGPYLERELDTGHWIMEERPDEAVDAILSHIAEYPD